MNFIIPEGGFKIMFGADGVETEVHYQLNLHLLPFWLEIAIAHVVEAQRAHKALVEAQRNGGDGDKGDALRAEFIASMQAIVAGATAIEAFYASVKRCVSIPEETLTAWKKNRTSRHKQIAEVLRLAFRLSPQNVKKLQADFKRVAKFRGWAVHPPAEPKEPRYHGTLEAIAKGG